MKPPRIHPETTLAYPSLALLALLTAGACGGADPAPPGGEPDGAAVDAAAPPPRDAGAREVTPPYERPLPPPEPTGHAWRAKDVGPAPAPNRAAVLRMNTGSVRVTAGGAGIGATADSFAFVSQRVRGDTDVLARVRSLQMADPTSTAGIMFRADDTDPGAPGVFVGILADPLRGGQVIVRRTKDAVAEVLPTDVGARAPQFLRIRREGRRFTIWRSPTPTAWVKLGTVELDLPPEVSVGVAVASRSAAALTTADLDLLRVFSFDAAAAGQGWDLDFLNGQGTTASLAAGELTVTGATDGFGSTGEQGTPVLAPVSGSHTVTAKVEALGAQNTPRARLALTFREGRPWGLNPSARHVMISVNAAGLVQFQRRDGTTNFEPGMVKDGLRPPVWLRLVRVDDPVTFRTRVSGHYSSDGRAWTELDGAEIALADPVMAGVLLTSGDSRTYATARLTGLALVPTAAAGAPSPDAGVAGADRP